MRTAVANAFKSFSTTFEGYLTFMYGDVKNLVTTGMGNLIDPIGQALSLPWVNADGSAASQQQITDAWNAVKARTDLNQKGGGAYASVTTIRLTDAGIDQLIQSRLKSNEATLRSKYPGYDNWPADAQLGILSMSWAMGPAFKFPKFAADVNANPPDFTTAATDCKMNETGNPGLIKRNVANNKLFLNAAAVLANKADPDTLYYPGDVPAGASTTTTAAPGTTTTAAPAATTTAAPAATTTSAPAATTTAAPASATTAAPAATTTSAPASTTTGAPAPATTSTSAPSPTTTAAPGSTTTSSAATTTTASPSQTSTAAPGSTTTAAASGGPTITGSFGVDPSEGPEQNPLSIQVPTSAKLTLTWSATNAASVNIDLLGDGLAVSGTKPIDTKDNTYTLVAVADDGTQSQPLVLTVATHDDGDVVSPHSDLASGVAAILSFTAVKGGQPVTSAAVGDSLTLTAVVSAGADAVKINDADAGLASNADGTSTATTDVSVDASTTGEFTCQALSSGAVGDTQTLKVEIAQQSPSTTTTAAAASTTTTAAPGTTTTAGASTTTTAAPGSTTTAPGNTTTAAPNGTTTAAPNGTTTAAPNGTTTAAPGTTTTQAGPYLWLKLSTPGSEDKWQWTALGKLDTPSTAGGGPFAAPSFNVPFSQLQAASGAQRLNLTVADSDNPFVDNKSAAVVDKGHYMVFKAKSDGTPDPTQTFIAGQFGDNQPDILRHIPQNSEGDLAVTVSKWNDDSREGAGFKYIKHFFVLMLENRSFDHMLGRNTNFPEIDGTRNPDGSDRTDCVNDEFTLDASNNLVATGNVIQAMDGADDCLVVDPGHEFTHVHYGHIGWGKSDNVNGPTNVTMRGFVGAYLNRLSPRTAAQGQWDGDALDTHYHKDKLPGLSKTWPTTDRIAMALSAKGLQLSDYPTVAQAVMKGYGNGVLGQLETLGTNYAVCDRWFAGLPGPTWPNRLFVHCGTSGGLDDSPSGTASSWRALGPEGMAGYKLPNIYDAVAGAGGKWMVFAESLTPQTGTVDIKTNNPLAVQWNTISHDDTGFKKFASHLSQYYGSADKTFTFLEPNYGALGIDNEFTQTDLTAAFVGGDSQHPISGASNGDALIGTVASIIKQNPDIWQNSALIVTWDEHGGFYDHVVPPPAIPPGGATPYYNPREPKGQSPFPDQFKFERYGVRVPALIISPRIPKGVVDHTIYDHTSLIRTVRKAFGISSPLSDREAAANDFSHLFTLETPRTD